MKSLVDHLEASLESANRPLLCNSVIPTLVHCINLIAQELRSSHQVAAAGSSNAFGDEQLNVDVLAEKIIRDKIRNCSSIVTASSEEDPVENPAREASDHEADTGDERYTIAFDPLDGSSIIAPNWTVGTIIGIWDGVSALHGVPSEKQVAAILGVYGPRTTAIIAVRVPGAAPTCFEIGLGQEHEQLTTCEIVHPRINLLGPPFKTRYFAPANMRAAAEDEKYLQLVTHYIQNKYTLRYSGGLVPDIVHTLVKGHGIYISPVTDASKAKLRRLYELTPIALIMECVGAKAIDPVTGEDILARPIENCDERAGLVCGTAEEVSLVKQSLKLGLHG